MFAGRTMLNLDTEDWNEIFIGCAGGGDSVLSFPTKTETLSGDRQSMTISVKGKAMTTISAAVAKPAA